MSPGGAGDILTRGIQPYLQKVLGVPVVVENVAGGGGIIGYTRVFAAKPDGYTLTFMTHLMAFIDEYLQRVQYKTREFTPLFGISAPPSAFVVNPQVYQTLPQFLEVAKSQVMKIGTSGYGSIGHLHATLISERLKFNARYVPFGGGAESLNALVGKHIDAVMVSVASSYGLVSSGVLKILFILGDKRSTAYPEFTPAKELGYTIPYFKNLMGVAGPPKLPKNIIKTLEEGFFKATEDPEFQAIAQKARLDIISLNAEEYKREIEQGCHLVEEYRDLLKKK